MSAPTHCRPEAYRHFQDALPALDTPAGLLRAAIAVSEHELRGVHHDLIEGVLDQYAREIRSRIPGLDRREPSAARDEAILAHTHQLLFDEVGYRGDRDDYQNPRNSYVPEIIRTRKGIPVSLCIVYQSVCDRVGLAVRGINAPYHFLARVRTGPVDRDATSGTTDALGRTGGMARDTLIDVFGAGRVIDEQEALDAIAEMSGASAPPPGEVLPVATHGAWISRLIRNLTATFERAGRPHDVAAMLELQHLLREHTKEV